MVNEHYYEFIKILTEMVREYEATEKEKEDKEIEWYL